LKLLAERISNVSYLPIVILAYRIKLTDRHEVNMEFSLGEIHTRVGGYIQGDANTKVHGVSSLALAQKGEISFAESERYVEEAKSSNASVLVVPHKFPKPQNAAVLRSDHPRQTFIAVMMLFDEAKPRLSGIHTSAVVAEDATLGDNVTIGEHAVIKQNTRIASGTLIDSGVYIGFDVEIGSDCVIGPNAVILEKTKIGNRVTIHPGTVIGGDGFGYVWTDDHHRKIPQIGAVVIEDDVEIGCNVCIDRATFGETRIHRGVKIDNLVQIGHNNDIGEHSVIVSQVGLSGSVTVGKRVTLAGQVGVADHINIGDGATAAARTGISKNIPPKEISWGAPNRPMKQVLRELASLARLPRLFREFRELADRVNRLEKNAKAQ